VKKTLTPATIAATTTSGVNTPAVVAGAAAAAAAQNEEPGESTPWGWIAFAILAAGVLGGVVVWLIRRGRGGTPTPG
jgi:CHASE2 domain-containing sensor protein